MSQGVLLKRAGPKISPAAERRLRWLPHAFCVCRFAPDAVLPTSLTTERHVFLARTSEELSLVCPAELVDRLALAPQQREADWRAFKVDGQLDFALVGILAGIANTLASHDISLFALSTFDTDYILVQETDAIHAATALAEAGYEVLEAPAVR